MRFLTARRLALAACVPVLLLFSVIPGCSNESEGERCGDDLNDPGAPGATNDSDCASGLVCVPASTLANSLANRCCNSDSTVVNDSRCLRATGPALSGSGGADAGDAGGTSGSGGSAGTTSTPDASSSAGASDTDAGGV